MAVVGEASVIVRAVTTGVKNDIQKAFDGADRIGEKAGNDAGASFSKGFRNKSQGDVAFLFGKSLSQSDVNKFTDARERFLSLARTGYTLSSALTVVGGAIGAVVGGLGVLVSIAGAATPALLALSGGFLAVAASAAVLKATFGGVSEAISAGAKVTGGAAVDANTLRAAEERVSDALFNQAQTLKENTARKEEGVKATQDAARAQAEAAIGVERAERSYRDAVRGSEKALQEVTKDREDAKEAIQQLRFELEGGVISEKKARLEFEKARESLQRVQDLPPNSRARREAELAFAEADLNLRRAIDKNNDLRKSTAKANREGVDGNERVVAAQEKLVSAREAENDANIETARAVLSLKDATESLTKAREFAKAGGELDIQNNRRLELATREVRDAKIALANVKNPGLNDFQAALDKLSPAAQDFVKYILSLKDAFEELRKKLQEAFFPKFTEAVKLLVETLLPELEASLITLAAKLGELALLFAEGFTTPKKVEEIKTIFESFTPIVDALGKAFIALASSFVTLQAAFTPYTIEFAQFIQKKAEALQKTIELKEATGELEAIFKTATDIVRKLGEALGNTFSAFGTIISATVAPGGAADFFLQWLIKVTAGWEETTKKLNEEGKLAPFLLNLTIAGTKILEIIGLIAVGFLQIAASPGFISFLESIKKVTLIFNEVGLEISKEGGALDAFGKFLVEFAKLVKIVTESESIVIFFRTLTGILQVLNGILGTEFGQTVLAITGGLLAFSAATNITGKAFAFYGDSLKGALLGMTSFIDKGLIPFGVTSMPMAGGIAKIRQELMFLTYGIGFVSTGFIAATAAIAAVVAVFVLAYKNSEDLRNALDVFVKTIGKTLVDAFKTISDAINDAIGNTDGLQKGFKAIGDFLAQYVIPIFQFALVTAIDVVAGAISIAIRIVAGFFKAFFDPWAGLQLIISGFVQFFKTIFKNFIDFVRMLNVFSPLSDGLKATINKMIKMWNDFKLEVKVPNNAVTKFFGIAGKGFTIETPNVDYLAKGGIVPATPGGTLAMIGEAGRPERVEPLDPDGLSKRDKAMIEMLAGPAGGINITVNPSPGMDERELAALVSRQLAFQLRKGAA
jgi:hypothetical protein